MKILFLVPYPAGQAPSQRFRFEQYFNALTEKGHIFHIRSFLNSGNWKLFFKKGKIINKIIVLIDGFLRRTGVLLNIRQYDFVFIHRETLPFGPPVIEWVIAKIFKKKLIYDFDDAIWLSDGKNESAFLKLLKWRRKVASICKWSYKISCGNNYLCAYAGLFNKNVVYNPTTIDTEKLHNPDLYPRPVDHHRIILGWTGSHSTLKYLRDIESVLQALERRFPRVDFWVIADQSPELNLQRLFFKPWSLDSEITVLTEFTIGIMPLLDDDWAKGKCGFKALQYMAMEIPTVASSVGVNNKIIEQGKDGFLCHTLAEWEDYLTLLIEKEELRKSIGSAARSVVVRNYSTTSNTQNFLNLFS